MVMTSKVAQEGGLFSLNPARRIDYINMPILCSPQIEDEPMIMIISQQNIQSTINRGYD
jgi:hypothetical protein